MKAETNGEWELLHLTEEEWAARERLRLEAWHRRKAEAERGIALAGSLTPLWETLITPAR